MDLDSPITGSSSNFTLDLRNPWLLGLTPSRSNVFLQHSRTITKRLNSWGKVTSQGCIMRVPSLTVGSLQ